MHRLPLFSPGLYNGLNFSKRSVTAGRNLSQRLEYATALPSEAAREATDIAVLGGGITGLASAYFLSRRLPNINITVYEASPRLGGWLHSEQVDVDNGKVIFERGPRNLRPSIPNGLVTLDLVRDLGLEDRLLTTSKTAPAAQNRFIYYPDHLVRMPGPGLSLARNLFNLWSEPVFKGIIPGALTEVSKPRRPDDLQDESIGSFLSRRFGLPVTDNVASAVLHGIYAGDVDKLSARSILPKLWEVERHYGSIVQGTVRQMFGESGPIPTNDLELVKGYREKQPQSDPLKVARNSSVFTLKGGIEELVNGLEASLLKNDNVNVLRNTFVEGLQLKTDAAITKVQITTSSHPGKQKQRSDCSHVISTLSGRTLSRITENKSIRSLWPTIGQTDAVTVMVVNVFFRESVLPVHGFGYLLPRSIPIDQNPERALGVVFDSDASFGQDNASGTKITVMLGGHWWDGYDAYPDEAEGASMARAVLRRHLHIAKEPRAIRVSIQRDCIPQYTVGHDDRMARASQDLEEWKGRLRVAGNSYTGVGLNDCVRAAGDVVTGLVDGTMETGLESFVGGRKWSWVKAEDTKIGPRENS